MRVRRTDFFGSELSPPVELPNGFLELDGYPTRAGIFRYLNPDGSQRLEFRSPEEVSKADSLKSLEKKPLTDEHPPGGIVTPQNVKEYGRGLVLDGVVYDTATNRVRSRVIVTHADLISVLQGGEKRELSCGYEADVVAQAGEWEGQPYTHIQLNIAYNHLAVVKAGRAGPNCALRLDEAGHVSSPLDTVPPSPSNAGNPTPPHEQPSVAPAPQERRDMAKIYFGGIEFEVEDKVAAAIAAERAQFDVQRAQLEAKLAGMATKTETATTQAVTAQQVAEDAKRNMSVTQAENTGLKQQMDSLRAKADSLEAKLAQEAKQRADAADPAKMLAQVQARVELQALATQVLGTNYQFTHMVKVDGKDTSQPKTDHEVRVDALEQMAKMNPAIKGKLQANRDNTAYIAVMFDTLAASFRADGAPLRHMPGPANLDADATFPTQPDVLLAKALEASRNAWQSNRQ